MFKRMGDPVDPEEGWEEEWEEEWVEARHDVRGTKWHLHFG